MAGPDNGNLLLTDNATDSPQSVTLTGRGTAPAVTLSQTSLDFGTVPAGTTSAPQNVTLTNTGDAPLDLTSIDVDNADFQQNNNCPLDPSTLGPGLSCSITVTVMPASDAGESATISVTDNALDSPQPVTAVVNGGQGPVRPTRTESRTLPTPRQIPPKP